MSSRELAGLREDIQLAKKRQQEMRRDTANATRKTRETVVQVMNLRNVLQQREAELAKFTQSVCDTGNRYSILGGKIVKVEETTR